jgi:hypothetical protein
MGRKAKRILSVVAAIAIPFAAPLIAGSAFMAGVTSAMGMTASSALVGAGLGAVKGAAFGEDIGRSALQGGIGGGIAGYMQTPAPISVSQPSYIAPDYLGGNGAFLGEGAASSVPSFNAAQAAAVTPTVAPIAATPMADFSSGYIDPGLRNAAGLPGGSGVAGTPYVDPTTTFSTVADRAVASMGDGAFVGEGAASSVPSFNESFASAPAGNVGLTMPSGPAYTPYASSIPDGYIDPGLRNAAGLPGGSGVAGTPYNDPGFGTRFANALKEVPSAIADKFTDPKTMADFTLKAAGAIAGSYMAGDGMTPEELQLFDMYREDLQQEREQNPKLFEQRLASAQQLLGDAKYFDPEYFGLQRARRAQIAGARAKRAGLRGLSGDRRAAEARRFDLETGRLTGTAFDSGFQSAIGPRLQTMQAGLQMMPNPNEYRPSYANLSSALQNARTNRATADRGYARLFGAFTGS